MDSAISSQNTTTNTNHSSYSFQSDIKNLTNYLKQHIIDQDKLLNRILITCFCSGHLLVEGAPGLAKTKTIKTFASCIDGSFQRIQFTPDLLPADITGTEIYRPENGSFNFQSGPIFNNIILADEINRAPAKVQSALLEAMAEQQVTIGKKTHKLPNLFMVMATQNSLEHEGTYRLPEAQLDRFLMHINLGYPNANAELAILRCIQKENLECFSTKKAVLPNISQENINQIKQQILNININPNIEEYIVRLVLATRNPEKYKPELKNYLEYGASPRGTISLAHAARAHAWLDNRNYVIPEDVKNLAHDVLRHRIGISYIAEAENITTDQILSEIIRLVAIP